MNKDIICLPKISNNISELQKESSQKNNSPSIEECPSNININKIMKNCIYRKSKTKFKMKIKKEFIGFQNSNKFLLNNNCNKLIINEQKNHIKKPNSHNRKLSSFGISNRSKLLKKENSFYKFVKNNNNNNIYHTNKKLSSYSRSKNIYLDKNIMNDTYCKTHRKKPEINNQPIKYLSQKKVNNLNYIQLFSSLYPFTNIEKKINNNFKIIISNNNKDKDKKNKNKNVSIEESKTRFNKNNQKKILTSTNPTSSIEITDKNENEYNLLKNKIKKNFCSTMRKSLFTTRTNKNANNNNNIKNEYIDQIKTLSFKLLNEPLNTPRKGIKNNVYKLKLDNNKLYDYNYNNYYSNNNEKNDYERNDLDIFLRILDIHLRIESIILKMNKSNVIICFDIENNNKLKMIKSIIDLINKFFSIIKLVCFDIDFLIEINKNRLVRKTIKILISYYSFLLILLKENNIESTIKEIENIKIFHQLSKILYNIFEHYIFNELISNNYDIKFLDMFKEISIKNKYIIKNDNNSRDILSILVKKADECLINFKNKIEEKIKEEKYITINPAFNSILSLLININNKSILMYINLTINVILYSILDKHINSFNPINNSNNNRNKINKTVPYLPPMDNKYKYTLVLDMDETLIHFLYKNKNNNNILKFNMIDQNDIMQIGMFLLRPYAKLFFEKLKDLYEIIIFTNGTKEYCDRILELIDPKQEYIKFRLYRKHSISKDNDIYLKDLSLLGRDLNKIIIIDDLAKNYKLQQDNGLPITSWKGDVNDTALKDLIPILIKIVENNVEDVRKIIVKIKKKLNELKTNNYFVINNNNDNNDLFVNDN